MEYTKLQTIGNFKEKESQRKREGETEHKHTYKHTHTEKHTLYPYYLLRYSPK